MRMFLPIKRFKVPQMNISPNQGQNPVRMVLGTLETSLESTGSSIKKRLGKLHTHTQTHSCPYSCVHIPSHKHIRLAYTNTGTYSCIHEQKAICTQMCINIQCTYTYIISYLHSHSIMSIEKNIFSTVLDTKSRWL